MAPSRALFERLIDDAGLFPPARKSMAQAVADHEAARTGEHAWMVGRFLCPVSRLPELAAAGSGVDWRIGAICDGDGPDPRAAARADLAAIAAWEGPGRIELIEARLPAQAPAREHAEAFAEALRVAQLGRLAVFLEVPAGGDPASVRAAVDAVAHVRRLTGLTLGAKLRCGGLVPEAFPPDDVVAAFVEACRARPLPFKATAGLHHPLRTRDEAIGALQHGFLNLLAATALPVMFAAQIVAERDPEAFELGAEGLSWRGHLAGPPALAWTRRLFTAFGSCSLDEPTDDLTALGMLPSDRRGANALA